jgi:TolA-binding protein
MAQALLVQCYYKTKAYQTAIDYIAALPYKNEMLLKLYQKVLFYQGLEAYNKGKQEDAIKCLRQSLLFLFKPSLALQAQFWLGEAYSALGAYQKALECYTTVMEKGSCNTLYHEKALYGLAYAYFNTGDYTNAAKNFEQYVNITEKQPSTAHYDAILRLGDCYYVKKNYEQALNRYESVYTYHPAHVRYQEALIYQLLGNSLLATQCLQEVITTHVQTKYYEKALFQEACMLFTTGNYQAAIQKFTYLIEKCSTSDLQPEWLMKRALAYENLHKMEEAAADYIAILEHYPSHENVESACMALSNIFSAQGTPEKMDKYLQKHTQVAQQLANHSDTHTLERAKKLFYSEQYAKVLQQLTSFDKRYPKSTYLPEVYLLMAESYYRLHNTNQAINFYKKVEASGQTGLHKKVWLRIADLAYQNNKFQEALIYYQKLHKMQMQLSNKEYYRTSIGLIKASFAIKQYQTTIPVCLQLVHNPKEIPAEIIQQARLYLGKVAMQRSEYKNAKGHFLKASTPPYTAIAAEAQYLLAHAEFKLKAYKASLNVLFELIEKFPHNKNYIDPAFLLMADNYIILGNFTQAQATLDSIISQSKNKKNIELAKKKRAEVMSKLKKVKNLPVK